MPDPLPWSFSPHICVQASPDVESLLSSSSLPSIHEILQSFSPLPQITTHTTTLIPVSHQKFPVRFSDLRQIEHGCRESEERRAERTLQWISARINKQSKRWIEEIEKAENHELNSSMPWWVELCRCVEGDNIPTRAECWNHPAAVICVSSTEEDNPLQSATALRTRKVELPDWIEPSYLQYSLILHPSDSRLSKQEAIALCNAVKKQYGLNVYLLSLELPKPTPPPVVIPTFRPHLPDSAADGTESVNRLVGESSYTGLLHMSETDIKEVARFLRDFVTTCLIPWMEKCVLDLHESYTSSRRLPSRLFSTTRRIFGSSSSTGISTSSASLPANSNTISASLGEKNVMQQRRLAEFATTIGDYKVAINVWDMLRKDSHDFHGSDVLPLLLSSPSESEAHIYNSLMSLSAISSIPPAIVQYRAIVYAVRWQTGIQHNVNLKDQIGADRILYWAVGALESLPAAIVLSQAGALALAINHQRRALATIFATARILLKCGSNILSTYFFRQAHHLCEVSLKFDISPLFLEAQSSLPKSSTLSDTILPAIEYHLGLLSYGTDNHGPAEHIFNLLRGLRGIIADDSNDAEDEDTSASYLEALYAAFKDIQNLDVETRVDIEKNLELPFRITSPEDTDFRVEGNEFIKSPGVWYRHEEIWDDYWRSKGVPKLTNKVTAIASQTFWLDVTMKNPINASLTLRNISAEIQLEGDVAASIQIATVDSVDFKAKEKLRIPIAICCDRALRLEVTAVTFSFDTCFMVKEMLSTRGPRLNHTAMHRQNRIYGPSNVLEVDVEEKSQRLLVNCVDSEPVVVAHGEIHDATLHFSNLGTENIDEIWMVNAPEDYVSLYPTREKQGDQSVGYSSPLTEHLSSNNSLFVPNVTPISLETFCSFSALHTEGYFTASLRIHAHNIGNTKLPLLFIFKNRESAEFRRMGIVLEFSVLPLLDVSISSQPSADTNEEFILDVVAENSSEIFNDISISQISTLSPTWTCSSIHEISIPQGLIHNRQVNEFRICARLSNLPLQASSGEFLISTVSRVLDGKAVDDNEPPPINVIMCHMPNIRGSRKSKTFTHHDIEKSVRHRKLWASLMAHPHIPYTAHQRIFPLYGPLMVDFIIHWEMPLHERFGYIVISGLRLGAEHALLNDVLHRERQVKRSMYAETEKERSDVLDSIERSEWNGDSSPIYVDIRHEEYATHDFTEGPCKVEILCNFHNLSATNKTQFSFSRSRSPLSLTRSSLSCLRPSYVGRTKLRGILGPMERATMVLTACLQRPGLYDIDGWQLLSEVLEIDSVTSDAGSSVRQSYLNNLPVSSIYIEESQDL